MKIRKRCLPGGWYPTTAEETRREIESFMDYIEIRGMQNEKVTAGIVPHAGWYFSGKLAALVFHAAAKNSAPDVVAIFGGHLGAGGGVVYADDSWETPLGPMEVDKELVKAVIRSNGLRPEGPSTGDNTVEVQLPLANYFFPEAKLLALRAPHSTAAVRIGLNVIELAEEQGKRVLAIGSTDLTHYGPNYGFLPHGTGPKAIKWVKEENDRGFIDLALEMNLEGMLQHADKNRSACSAGGAVAAAAAAKAMGTEAGVLADYYTSAEIMDGSSFVGYAGILY